jgi:Rhs element Vgr protein
VNGSEVPQQFRAETINITKEANRIPTAKLVFVDGSASEEKFEASNGALFIPGNAIEISAGYESDNHLLFKGIIIKQALKIRSNNAVLTIECKDKAIKMTVGTKNKYYTDNEKDSDIISAMIGRYGLTADVEASDVTHKEMVQFETTDWDFMVNRADVNGKLVIVDDGQVAVKKPDFTAASILSLVYGATILELDAEIDARFQFKKVKSQSWSSDDQDITEATVADPRVSLNGNQSAGTLAGVIDLDEYILKHGGAVPEQELQSWGKAFWWKQQSAKVRGRVKFKGTHVVKPGMIIELSGVSDRINGKCFVSAVQHHIAAGEWQTDAQLGVDPVWFTKEQDIMQAPASGLVSGVCGLQVGVVTQLESDPDGKDRIKVFLPIINKSEQGFWARIATLDAGKDRGSFFLPEIGDEVIVGFINDDPRDAIVLGMMNSSAKPAPLKAADTNDQKGFVTRSKMKMLFDDKKISFTLSTPAGKTMVVDENAGIMKLEDENGNKIIMDTNGISIESFKEIKMKATTDYKLEAVNIENKASASFKAEGSASAELKASGSVTVKGAIVQIN